MNKSVSLPPEFLSKLQSAEGEGLSRDPKNNPRKTIKLLTDKDDELKPGSTWYRSAARAGQYVIGDTLSDDFILTPILYLDAYVEWKFNGGGYGGVHYALPTDAKWDPKARCHFRDNGNSVEDGADIVGQINQEVYWLSFRGPAVNVARSFNSAASTLMIGSVQLPFFGANWRMGSVEKVSSRGKRYWQTTYEHVANVGQSGGPTLDDFDRCRSLCHLLKRSIGPTKSRITASDTDAASAAEDPPESGAPPPTGDDPPRSLADLDDIQF
jgi:hypothetical protein